MASFWAGARLLERVGDELELRLLVEAGRPRADQERVAVDGGERVDAGRRLLGPERLAGLRVEGVDRARVVAGEDDVVRDRGRAEVHRRERSLPEEPKGGRVEGGEAAPAALEVRQGARESAWQATRARVHGEVQPGHEQAAGRERHRGLDPTEVTREDGNQLARERTGVVLVLADGARPERRSVRRLVGKDLAHLSGHEHDLGRHSGHRDGGGDRWDLEVVVAHVVWHRLPEPDALAGLAVQRDQRVRIEVWTWAAGAVREPLRAVQRRGVGDRHEDAPLAVDRRWVPEAAAPVDLWIGEELGPVGDRVERPAWVAGCRVERPHDAQRSARVERRHVAWDRADQDLVVVRLGRHVDALFVVPDQLAAPEQLAGLGVEREGALLGGPVDAAVAEGDAVRPDAGLVERMPPLELARRAVERVDV